MTDLPLSSSSKKHQKEEKKKNSTKQMQNVFLFGYHFLKKNPVVAVLNK